MANAVCLPCIRIVLCMTLLSANPAAAQHDSHTTRRTDNTTKLGQELVQQLGHSDYHVRVAATRKLLAMGPNVTKSLRDAAQSDELETALRARRLLDIFEEMLFAGVAVRIEANKTRIAWNESFDLTLHMSNTTAFPARVPTEPDLPHDNVNAPDAHAAQLARMLDLGDFLTITDPDENPLELFTDQEVTNDPLLVSIVHQRASTPVVRVLAGGDHESATLTKFNRGFARYRMLKKGLYRVQLVYQPEWNEEALNDAEIGRVESNILEIEVTGSAPEIVRQAWKDAEIVLTRNGNAMVASLTNLRDVPVMVNLNIAPPGANPPLAALRWSVERADQWAELRTVDVSLSNDARAFRHERIVPLAPGDSLKLHRVPVATLIKATDGVSGSKVSVYYVNQASRGWQIREGGDLVGKPWSPKPFDTPFPRRMLQTAIRSQAMELLPNEGTP